MDLNLVSGGAATDTSLPAGIDHAVLENDGPRAFGDKLGTPAPDERVLWKGRPDFALLARTAFHTHKLGLYFAALVVIALAIGNTNAAIVAAVLGAALLALLYGLAWLSARTTLYIVTDTRVIMRIGMAFETRINLPLKQISAAHMRPRNKGRGEIAFELEGERVLGTLLLWPHVRPWRYNRPQPMLRAIPDAAGAAKLIADARAGHGAIIRTEDDRAEPAAPAAQPARPISQQVRVIPAAQLPGRGFEGAPA